MALSTLSNIKEKITDFLLTKVSNDSSKKSSQNQNNKLLLTGSLIGVVSATYFLSVINQPNLDLMVTMGLVLNSFLALNFMKPLLDDLQNKRNIEKTNSTNNDYFNNDSEYYPEGI